MKKNSLSTSQTTFVVLCTVAAATWWLSSVRPWSLPSSPSRSLASSSSRMNFKARQKQRTQRYYSPFQEKKVQIDTSRINSLFTQQDEVGSDQNTPNENTLLPAGTELIAVIDRVCTQQATMVAQMSQDSFSYVLADRRVNRTRLKRQAFPFTLDKPTAIADLIESADADPCLIGLTEDGKVTMDALYNDPSSNDQTHLTNLQVRDTEEFFFESSITPTKAVVVAVVDTGIDYKHVDLVNNIWSDSQGRHGFDFVNEDSDPMDDNFHGTHVAGLIAAAGGNDLGGSGVMPAKAQLMAVKILDKDGNGSYSNVANGIYWAVENGADVINLSLSGPGQNTGVADALTFAANNGVPVFVSAGNNGVELTESNFRTPTSFGEQIGGVMTVGAVDSVSSNKSSFSNFSTKYIEISSPGSNGTLSTLPNNSFGIREGTSMSTPLVTGAAALIVGSLKSQNFPYTAAEIEEILAASAIKNSDLSTVFKEGRQLNLPNIKEYLLKNYLVQFDGGIDDED